MSSPSAARVQRIARVRTGCLKCRFRKKKCDERKPTCRACERNNFTCRWPSNTSAAGHVSHQGGASANQVSATSSPALLTGAGLPALGSFSDEEPLRSALLLDAELDFDLVADGSLFDNSPVLEPMPPVDLACINANPTVRPSGGALDAKQATLLEYYLHRTAESMSNGFLSANPFITLLIPAAFTSDLVLQLILAQSAIHRTAQQNDADPDTSNLLYARSTHQIQYLMNGYDANQDSEALPLALGTLIMCYTETARGGIDGMLFDHLLACPTILIQCLKGACGDSMRDFLIEYYFYTASVSMISVDTSIGSPCMLHPDLEQRAAALAASGYSGTLCGCWLDILLVIPKISHFGRELQQNGLSAETMAHYTSLHRQLLEWSPKTAPGSQGWAVAKTYCHAALLYLYTAVEQPMPGLADRHNELVQKTVQQALEALLPLPPSARINTSLCWPLAVIGSCLFEEEQQASVRSYLQAMSASLGLGNIAQTLRLLEFMWASAGRDAGPWSICNAMQTYGIWISFA